RLAHQRDVAGGGFVPARGHAHEGLGDLFLGQPHRIIIRAVRRALGPHSGVARGKLVLVDGHFCLENTGKTNWGKGYSTGAGRVSNGGFEGGRRRPARAKWQGSGTPFERGRRGRWVGEGFWKRLAVLAPVALLVWGAGAKPKDFPGRALGHYDNIK